MRTLTDWIFSSHATVSEEQADRLATGSHRGPVTEIQLPRGSSPSIVPSVIRTVSERSTKWLGLRNTSAVLAFEIRRIRPDRLRLQIAAPTNRVDRKVRTQLSSAVPGIGFDEGVSGLPVTPGETVGGATFALARRDCYPLETEFDRSPNTAVTSLLHRHAMQNAKIVIQVLVKPVAGQPLKNWWWNRRAFQAATHHRKEKEHIWGSTPATKRDRSRADSVEAKADGSRYHVSLRMVVIGAGEHVPSIVREISAGYNVFENETTGQYLMPQGVRSIREKRIVGFAQEVADREFGWWSNSWTGSLQEVGALLSLPEQRQENLQLARP